MKKILVLIIASISLTSCVTLQPKSETVILKEMEYQNEKEKREEKALQELSTGEGAALLGISLLRTILINQ